MVEQKRNNTMEIKAETYLGDSINVEISHKLIIKMLRKTKPSVDKMYKVADWLLKKNSRLDCGALSKRRNTWYWAKESDFSWHKYTTEELWGIYLQVIK